MKKVATNWTGERYPQYPKDYMVRLSKAKKRKRVLKNTLIALGAILLVLLTLFISWRYDKRRMSAYIYTFEKIYVDATVCCETNDYKTIISSFNSEETQEKFKEMRNVVKQMSNLSATSQDENLEGLTLSCLHQCSDLEKISKMEENEEFYRNIESVIYWRNNTIEQQNEKARAKKNKS